jgi:DNA-binding HxlR family transcriptional regulator
MTRTDKKVGYLPKSKLEELTPVTAASGVENVLRILEGRWKLVILFHLFGGNVLRFSDLERAIPAVSQKMLIQQLRQMEADGIVRRIVHHQVPPKVEYCLTDWGQALCPALDALLKWAEQREAACPVSPSHSPVCTKSAVMDKRSVENADKPSACSSETEPALGFVTEDRMIG